MSASDDSSLEAAIPLSAPIKMFGVSNPCVYLWRADDMCSRQGNVLGRAEMVLDQTPLGYKP